MTPSLRAADRSAPTLSRRGFLVSAAGGLGAAALTGAWASPARAVETPKLPGEYYRKASQRTPNGTLYDNISVRINGDTARLHVPQSVAPGNASPVQVVWFYHGAGSDFTALDGGFRTHSAAVIDRGAISICQTAGGTLYANPTAVSLQSAGAAYMAGLFNVGTNVLRATSAGGALATETYASRLLPNISGMYNVNAAYDMVAFYNQGGRQKAGVVQAYGSDLGAIQAGNPARHPAADWAGTRLRVVVSQPESSDESVPPSQHGLALRALALPVAIEASVRTHTDGHNTPGFALSDFMDALNRWPVLPVDTTAPSVAITSPADGSTVKGTVTLTATATDAVGVTDVGIYQGSTRMLTLAQGTGSQWSASINTKTSRTPNGSYALTAVATDAAGNAGTSPVVTIKVAN